MKNVTFSIDDDTKNWLDSIGLIERKQVYADIREWLTNRRKGVVKKPLITATEIEFIENKLKELRKNMGLK